MRCKKCGYISFDQMETCGGCKKNIAKDAKELSGVVFKSESPDFLWFKNPEEEHEEEIQEENSASEEESGGVDFGIDADDQASDGNDTEFSIDTVDSGLDISSEQPQEIEFDLSADSSTDEEPEPEEHKEEIAFDLPEMEEAVSAPQTENLRQEKGVELPAETSDDTGGLDDLGLDFDLDDSPAAPAKPEKAVKPAKKESSLDLDLGGLDLDGLMPPAAEKESNVDFSSSGLGGLSLESAPEQVPSKKTAGGKSKRADDTLPDLAIEGLGDFDPPILPPTANVAEKKLRPASKTGTALDEFDIDLGDLLGGGKK